MVIKLSFCPKCRTPHVPPEIRERVLAGESIEIEIVYPTGVAGNVLKWGTGAINIDGCRIDSEKPTGWAGAGGNTWNDDNMGLGKDGEPKPVNGRWPANLLHDGSDEVVAEFPDVGGSGIARELKRNPKAHRDDGYGMDKNDSPPSGISFPDSGSAARFFYSAKADAEDRWGSKHPTVKPVDLIRWLSRLITPPNGTVLDCFAGSGTLAVAAIAEKFNAILVEREDEYVADIRERITFYEGEGRHSMVSLNRKKKAPAADPLRPMLFE